MEGTHLAESTCNSAWKLPVVASAPELLTQRKKFVHSLRLSLSGAPFSPLSPQHWLVGGSRLQAPSPPSLPKLTDMAAPGAPLPTFLFTSECVSEGHPGTLLGLVQAWPQLFAPSSGPCKLADADPCALSVCPRF